MKVIEVSQEVFGSSHELTLNCKSKYAFTLDKLKRCKEAEELWLEILNDSPLYREGNNYLL